MQKNGDRGFTLVESLVSIMILGLTVVAMLGVFVIGKVDVAKAKAYKAAINLARERMEELRSIGYAELSNNSGTYAISETDIIIDYGTDLDGDGDFDDGKDDDDEDEDELTGTRLTGIGTITHGGYGIYLQLDVTVSWQERRAGGTTATASETVTSYLGP